MKTKLLTGSLFAAVLLGLIYFMAQEPQTSGSQAPANTAQIETQQSGSTQASSAAEVNLIAGDNPDFQFTGRINYAMPGTPEMSWPGTMIRARFTGPSLAIDLEDQYGMNYFNVFIDEDWENPIIIEAKLGRKTYPIADSLTEGEHSFTLTKRTEGEQGVTKFHGVILADGESLLKPPARPERRIEFYGDSITSGMGNEAPEDDPDDHLGQKNSFMTYAAMTARNLDAEFVSISQSGIGLMVGFVSFTMQEYFDQLTGLGDNDSQWDFSQWIPDVVVINLFQNDSTLIEQRLDPIPDDEQRIQVYLDFVKTIRSKYPDAYIVCTLGTMDAVKPGSPWPDYIHAAVDRLKAETGDERVAVKILPFGDFYKHPRVSHHRENAEILTAFIKEKMGW